jgi:hypothetical protein
MSSMSITKIYCCILLNVIVMNSCISIMKDQLSCLIECNCDEWLYEYYKGSTIKSY